MKRRATAAVVAREERSAEVAGPKSLVADGGGDARALQRGVDSFAVDGINEGSGIADDNEAVCGIPVGAGVGRQRPAHDPAASARLPEHAPEADVALQPAKERGSEVDPLSLGDVHHHPEPDVGAATTEREDPRVAGKVLIVE